MFHSFLPTIFLLGAPAAEPAQWAQLTIERRVIVRVPMARKNAVPARINPEANDGWEERKGPRCVALKSIRGAAIVVRNGVDLILADQHRYRARLERGCDSAGFYSGFYVEPDDDGSLCSGRDELQARSGMSCGIEGFRRLVETAPDD